MVMGPQKQTVMMTQMNHQRNYVCIIFIGECLCLILPVVRPHHSTTYVDVAYCYRPSSVVCRSVTLVSPAKMAAPIELPFGLRTYPGTVIRWGPDPSREGANFSRRMDVPL